MSILANYGGRKSNPCKYRAITDEIYRPGKLYGRNIDDCKVKCVCLGGGVGVRNGGFVNERNDTNTIRRIANTISGCSVGRSGGIYEKLETLQFRK